MSAPWCSHAPARRCSSCLRSGRIALCTIDDVQQCGQSAFAHGHWHGHPPLQKPSRLPRAARWPEKRAISAWCRRGASVGAACPRVADSTALAHPGTRGNWSEWSPITLPGNVLGGPAVATDGAGLLHVMARGPDNRLWHTQQPAQAQSNGSLVEGAAAESADGAAKPTAWSQWQRAGTTVADSAALSSPTLAAGADGRVHAFALGEGRGVWHSVVPREGGAAWGWQQLGGVWASKPAAVVDASGALHVVVVGTDGALWATALPADGDAAHGWTAWVRLGGRFASVPKISVLRQAAGGLRVVARAANRTFAQSALRLPTNGGSGQWGALSTLPGRTWASGAAVLPSADGGLEVSARAVDLAIWHVSVAPDGTARRTPQSLGGRFAATPRRHAGRRRRARGLRARLRPADLVACAAARPRHRPRLHTHHHRAAAATAAAAAAAVARRGAGGAGAGAGGAQWLG